VDYVFRAQALPEGGCKFRPTRFETVGGGPAVTAAMSISRLGGAASLAARVGDDPIADAIIAELEAFGVCCDAVRRFPGRTSSLSAVMIDNDGERMIVNYRDDQLPTDASCLPIDLTGKCEAVLTDTR
jgi:sulfofructose kinase